MDTRGSSFLVKALGIEKGWTEMKMNEWSAHYNMTSAHSTKLKFWKFMKYMFTIVNYRKCKKEEQFRSVQCLLLLSIKTYIKHIKQGSSIENNTEQLDQNTWELHVGVHKKQPIALSIELTCIEYLCDSTDLLIPRIYRNQKILTWSPSADGPASSSSSSSSVQSEIKHESIRKCLHVCM